jgi:hypothetical protein
LENALGVLEVPQAAALPSQARGALPIRASLIPANNEAPSTIQQQHGAVSRIALRLLIDLRRLVAIVPPSLRDAARVTRFGRGPAEHVPIGEPVR